jgi:hypothetical protein
MRCISRLSRCDGASPATPSICTYFYVTSAGWKQKRPFPLTSSAPRELVKNPTYYIMDIGETMATAVASYMPSPVDIALEQWISDSELRVERSR